MTKKRVKAELDKYGENEIKGIDGSCKVYEHSHSDYIFGDKFKFNCSAGKGNQI